MDLILVFVINYFFKLKQERQADIFALRFSTSEEINQVATFFEKHQEILDTYGEKNFFASYLPSTVLIGYPNGKKRAAWLRRLVSCS